MPQNGLCNLEDILVFEGTEGTEENLVSSIYYITLSQLNLFMSSCGRNLKSQK